MRRGGTAARRPPAKDVPVEASPATGIRPGDAPTAAPLTAAVFLALT
ncbi:hypothetical protein GA0070606_5990 [Micromonospora citrea]|uniref:Uncharacterized protein n=1 Tax=Micromonospora citrea TaxID=47855 RepID=A0A1C6W0V9_9ACTN|nr:hypothetical protein GA0070606_5990 [Micromonospora citrea]